MGLSDGMGRQRAVSILVIRVVTEIISDRYDLVHAVSGHSRDPRTNRTVQHSTVPLWICCCEKYVVVVAAGMAAARPSLEGQAENYWEPLVL